MAESAELQAKIKECDPDIQEYISALKAINAKQHKRIFQLEAENVSLEYRIAAIKEGNPDPSIAQMDTAELLNQLNFAAEHLGYALVKKES